MGLWNATSADKTGSSFISGLCIKSAQADLDEKFIELGKLYYEIISNDNIFDEKTAAIVQEIDSINTRIKELEANLDK